MPLTQTQKDFLESLNKHCIHGKNILAKKDKPGIEIFFSEYQAFYYNMDLPLKDRINAFIRYKEFAHKENTRSGKPLFSPQSKFEPTILEEFLYHLFKEFEDKPTITVGSVKAYSNLYFSPTNLKEFRQKNFIKINLKDQDFAIYKQVHLQDDYGEEYSLSVPIVSIECKTYLDKTMLEGSIATAEKIKVGNPHCKFYIVTETYEVKYTVDPSTSRIDNIFVLKKGGRNKRNGAYHPDVIQNLYQTVAKHLQSNWSDIKHNVESKGTIF